MRPPGSPEALERRRMRALTLLKEGLPPVEVARQLRIDRRSVRRWRARYRRRGPSSLLARACTGSPAEAEHGPETKVGTHSG